MNHKKTNDMDVLSDYQPGYYGRSFDERMERIVFLYEEIQVYRLLLHASQRCDGYDQALLAQELSSRRDYLERNL